jgi:small nuclear ribonucleoprotein (snRNP)-like protein
MTFIDEMKTLQGTEIVIIMVDGRGYRGLLESVDSEVVVLTSVFETQNQEVDERGYMFWRKVLHSKVFLRVPMIMRVWPWDIASKTPPKPKIRK